MPRYGFQCKDCQVEFEVSRSMSQAGEPAKCPHCQQDADRIFFMPMTQRKATLDDSINDLSGLARAGAFAGHGHSHAPGAAPHTH